MAGTQDSGTEAAAVQDTDQVGSQCAAWPHQICPKIPEHNMCPRMIGSHVMIGRLVGTR